MKNTPATEILFLLDRSGSMAPLIDDAVGGFNSFLETRQRDPAPSRMTLVLFDDRYEVPHASVPVTHIPPLTNGTFLPRGGTALLDAIGRSISDLENRLRQAPEDSLPDRIITAILTDGEENISRQWTYARISDLIRTCQEQRQWEFLFIAANQDAVAGAGRLGIAAGNAIPFAFTAAGTREAFARLSGEIHQRKQRPLPGKKDRAAAELRSGTGG